MAFTLFSTQMTSYCFVTFVPSKEGRIFNFYRIIFQPLTNGYNRTRKILGLLYQRFYNNASKDTLLQLYFSLVRPHLEYASPVWSPYMQKHIKQLKNVALRMATKSWDSGYQDLLSLTDIIALEPRRAQASLCMLFKLFMVYVSSHPMITTRPNQSAYKQATTAPTTICWYQCIFTLICATYCPCVELSLLLIYLCNILRVTLLTIVLNPVHNTLIAHCSCAFCLICSACCVHFCVCQGALLISIWLLKIFCASFASCIKFYIHHYTRRCNLKDPRKLHPKMQLKGPA